MNDSLEQQWKDHVNDGLVVRWFKQLVRRIRNWRRPPIVVALFVRIPNSEMSHIALFRLEVLPGEQRTYNLRETPFVLRADSSIYVETLVIDSPEWNGL